jgi:uncharacterized protein (DUF58 family)
MSTTDINNQKLDSTAPAAQTGQVEALLEPEFLKKLDQLNLLSRKVFKGRMKGERRSKKKGSSVEFADYRNYIIGDDLRYLDWNAYARLEKLFLKLFMEEEDLDVHFIIDCSKSMSFGKPDKLGYSSKIAAALGYIALSNYDRIMISAVTDRIKDYQPSLRGKSQVFSMFNFLKGLKSEGGTNLTAACREFIIRHKRPGVVIILSDFLDPGGYEPALKHFVARQFDCFIMHILDKQELDPQTVGDLRLIDSETETMKEVSITEGLLKRYKATAAAFCAEIENYSLKHGMHYLRTTTDTPFEDLILRYLKKAGFVV